ncbi:DNA adenine methylase [Hoeflea sp.]|uniref:DNA adenine methylase n=1 Tax=Hoeflea sp. TaxID=1940281 RepID=UPI0019B9FA3A|nr:DNA adenine methylase [Hoeflea sp.]MBC7280054.1 DNA adenine methylase [Hoeflea sp.]
MTIPLGFNEVRPIAPPAAYIGGKRQLAQRIAAIIEQIPHSIYAEPFVGMGGVFFRRRMVPRSEVINDRSGDVATLFRILQRHYPQLMDALKFQITSRADFDRLNAADPATLTDLERAARFLYLQKLAFGGKVTGRNFGVDYTGGARFNVNQLGPILADVHERLAGVTVENLDWCAFIERYDRPETLFYLDPPYYGNESDYGHDVFSRTDFARMARVLAGIKGRFVLSLNDRPEVRSLFSGFRFADVGLTYTLHGGEGSKVGEVIILDNKEPQPANMPRG